MSVRCFIGVIAIYSCFSLPAFALAGVDVVAALDAVPGG